MKGQPAKESPENLDFEGALGRLEEIVEGLEAGELGLEAALEAFEEGVALSRRCSAQLDDAERRIEILVEDGDELRTEPLETDEAEA
ncbi:MAG: exodeoxyribonuclease VII small subunit [bacterium]|nr:exodeoxyribonuclease VII small subunit [bacterium]